ncbi:hypothetical protein F5148DRAFT_731926 [Russula earlei]|uniref:Uncharacterized protein n=1 Tax=Russula earlei TaxID=71964 RepID=A0ACC0ULZ2_9AGAM|nr:hypothetical protein F5148DRAFT_731926 [Russula earlei]
MSRHRFVRNLDLDEELDDGALSDGEDDMTPEQSAQMEAALESIRAVLGSEEQSGFTDSYIGDSVWDFNFDIEETIKFLMEVQQRKNEARERKDYSIPSPSSLHTFWPLLKTVWRRLQEDAGIALPDDDLVAKGMTIAQIHAARMAQLAETRTASAFGTSFPNNQLQSIHPEDCYSFSDDDIYVRRLSTITERTERTEVTEVPARSSPSVAFSSRRSTRPQSSVTDSSYGEVIVRDPHSGRRNLPVDPNTIRPSPPPSALQPSHDGSEAHASDDEESCRTVTPPPPRPSAPVPPLESPSDIASSQIRSTRASLSKHPVIPVNVFKSSSPKGLFSPIDKPLPQLPPPSEPRHSQAESRASSDIHKRSKLSALASSRVASSKASTISQSSRMSSSTLATSSVRTYPALRPSSQSELSLIEEENGSSAASSMIRQAIRTALDQEAADRSAVSPQKQDKEVQHDSTVTSSPSSRSTVRPASEAKDGSPTVFYSAVESPPTSLGERPASKLAKLAQAKSKQGGPGVPKLKVALPSSPSPVLPSSHTEYLIPIANGPTATTAITTSYQTLGSLLSPSQSALPPSSVPSGYNSSPASSLEPRQSKLAMKAKKPHPKRSGNNEDDQANLPVPVHAMFKPEGTRSRASPSTFASILIDGVPLTSDEDKGHRKERRDKSARERRRSHGRTSTTPLDESSGSAKASPKHKSSSAKAAKVPLAPLGPFAFDIPSPDDIVLNARRGTSLARSASDASALTAHPASTAPSRSSFTSGSRVSTSAN